MSIMAYTYNARAPSHSCIVLFYLSAIAGMQTFSFKYLILAIFTCRPIFLKEPEKNALFSPQFFSVTLQFRDI